MTRHRKMPDPVAGRDVRGRFQLHVPDRLMERFAAFVLQQEFVTEQQAVVTLMEMALSTFPPEQVLASRARAHAFNETRHWTITMVANALKDIQKLLEADVETERPLPPGEQP